MDSRFGSKNKDKNKMKNTKSIIISRDGKIYANNNGLIRELPQTLNVRTGYWTIYIPVGYPGEGKKAYVHRIVCEKYHGTPRKYMECHHIDGNKNNNAADNLAWISVKDHRHLRQDYHKDPPRKGSRLIQAEKDGVRIFFDTARACGEYIGCTHANVSYVLNPKHYAKTACGWTLQYVERKGIESCRY